MHQEGDTVGSQKAVELEQVRAHVERVLKRHDGVFRALVGAACKSSRYMSGAEL